MTQSRLPRRWSIATKVLVGIIALLLLVIGTLAGTAYLTVRAAAEREARTHLTVSVTTVAELLTGAIEPGLRAATTAAGDPRLGDFLVDPTAERQAAAMGALEAQAARPGVVAVELWDAGHRRALAAGRRAAEIAAAGAESPAARPAGEAASVGSLRHLGGRVILPVMAPVAVAGRRSGVLVHWYPLALNIRLAEATFLLGNRDGSLWTDLSRVVPAPPLEPERLTGIVTYQRPRGGAQLAAAAAISGTPWLGLVEVPAAAVLAPADRFLRRLGAIALVLLVVALLAAWRWSQRFTGPLIELTAAAEAIAGGDLERRVAVDRRDELGRLAAAFNGMAEHLGASRRELEEKVVELRRTQEQFTHAQRLQAIGKLAGGVAHDFNNLLTIILGEAELALESPATQDPARHALVEVRAAAHRATGLTRQLLAFSRRQLIAPTVFDLNALVRGVESMLGRLIGEQVRITVRTADHPLAVRADQGQIEQVVVNLVVNARDAMPRGGRIHLETQAVDLDGAYAATRDEVVPGEYVALVVSDTGHGMTDEVKAHLFEPFFTTKEPGRGTGLGLAACYGIVKQGGGHLAVYSEAGVGTTMKVYLPRVEAVIPPVPAARAAVRRGNETILVVEDDPFVRELSSRMLGAFGYRILPSGDAETALETLAASGGQVDLMVTDVVLPGMSGRELADRAVAMRPTLKVLFVTGYTDDMALRHGLLSSAVALLQKPFTAEALGRKVRELLDQRAA